MFTKGQQVTYLQNWDSKGTVRIINLTVYSCGKKQMVLVNDRGEKFEGRHFAPTIEQPGHGWVSDRLAPKVARVEALRRGAEIVAEQRVRYARCLTTDRSPGYIKAITQDIADLHEPRFLEA